MDSYLEEIVIHTMPLVNTIETRRLSKSCLALCDERININDLRFVILFFSRWKSNVKRRSREFFDAECCAFEGEQTHSLFLKKQ